MNTAAERQKLARARKKAGALIQINMWISPEANQGLRQYAAQRSLMLNAALNELLISANSVPHLPIKSDQLEKIDQAKGKDRGSLEKQDGTSTGNFSKSCTTTTRSDNKSRFFQESLFDLF